MTQRKDGGPAFPVRGLMYDGALGGQLAHGASLRDYFAAAVAPTIWAQFQMDGTTREHSEWRHGVAVEAYRLADEMLSERAR